MNRDQARNLIRQTFVGAFDKGRFLNLTLNLLNHIDDTKASTWNNQYVKDAFKDHVHRYERLGTYTSPGKEKLDVLIVHLTKESKLERARTAIRNFVADHLKTRDEKDAALVAFVSPIERQWRFSYVKMEYATIEKDSGKFGVETRLTPARRLSYLVGEGESCHTAQTRFLNLLEDTETDPALAEIEDAFSVEAVTKEFFTKYTELFQEIYGVLEKLVARDKTVREEFKAKGINTVDFAKKLMGQIVFLYFLQKKGWLGVATGQDWGSGPHDFLRRLANGEHGKYDNFFNEILEPLFYDTLATDRGHEAWCNRFKCRLPFLNGGLFEPLGDYNWRKSDIRLPNCLFINSDHVEEGITGTGVLDVFDRYNFTVNEAEPLEKEVAIDPEMLGKVFENLIEENRRKGLGAYYTPREIVHYMCQQSLISYLDTAINTAHETIAAEKPKQGKLFSAPEPEQQSLKTTAYREIVCREDIETFVRLGEQISHYESVNTKYPIKMPKSIQDHARLIDEKLADITVCDPAVGSGAFPVGMMTEIVRARCTLTPYFNDVHERTPYHFKRHAIQNCLYGVDIDAGAVEIAKLRLWLSLVVDEEDVKQIKPLPNLDYKVVAGNSLIGFPFKSQRLHEIEKLKLQFFDESDHDAKAKLKQRIDVKLKECFAASRRSLGYEVSFDFEVYFSEVFDGKRGFDIVIGNPPYIRIQALNQQDKKLVELLKTRYESARKGNYDLYVVFVERGLRLLQPHGHFAFILPHKFFNAQYGQPLRGLIAKGRHLRHVVHFGDQQIFPGATNYVCLLFLARAGTDTCRFACTDDLNNWLATRCAPEASLPASRITDTEWNFAVGHGAGLFERLERMPVKLGNAASIFVGLQTSADDVFIMNFVSETANMITLRSKALEQDWTFEKALLHPLVSGTDVRPYANLASRQFILFPYVVTDTVQLISLGRLGREFPKTAEYLQKNKKRLEDREGGRLKDGDWHGYIYLKNMGRQALPKVCVPRLVERLNATLDPNGTHFLDNVDVGGVTFHAEFSSHSLFYLLALLNSSLLRWFFPHVSAPFRGGWHSANRQFLSLVPFRPIDFSAGAERAEHDEVAGLVEHILAAKKLDPEADTTAWEREIDQLVYKLYDLIPEEIALVEESTHAK